MGEKQFVGKTAVSPLELGPAAFNPKTNPQTVLVVGQPRGGTSAVAGILDALGVYMGPPAELRGGGSFESYVFVHGTAAERLAEVDRCNKEYNLWGWKQPFGVHALDLVPRSVRNLHCVFVFRDIAALAHAYVHHNNITPAQALRFAKDQNDALYDRAMTSVYPRILMSYERIKDARMVAVEAVRGFLGLTATGDQLNEAFARIGPQGGYVKMEESYGGSDPAPLPDRWKGHPRESID